MQPLRSLIMASLATVLFTGTSLGAQSPLVQSVNSALDLKQSQLLTLAVHGEAGGRLLVSTKLGLALELRPHSVRAPGFQLMAKMADGSLVRQTPDVVRTYRGEVIGMSRSKVAASFIGDGIRARILFEGGEEYWLQPVPGSHIEGVSRPHVLFRAADIESRDHGCGTDKMRNAIKTPKLKGTSGGGGSGLDGIQVAEIACEADFEYFGDYGSAAAVSSQIESVINTVNLQYESQVEITHQITTVMVQTSVSQPYSSNDAETLLNQFRSEWNAKHSGVQRDIAHLFTGKEIIGGTIGIAWVGVICNQSYGYGVVQSDFNGNFACSTDLSAHELGHNWSANHCGCTQNTMNAYITCANVFHPRQTVREMLRYIKQVPCLGSGGGGGTNPATDTHVESITVSTQGLGRGDKVGKAVVVILDDQGQAVAGALVSGDFSGSLNETVAGVLTDVNGIATLTTSSTGRGGLSLSFCVTGVSATLSYNASSNVETCDSN